jgi:hypothetical protein
MKRIWMKLALFAVILGVPAAFADTSKNPAVPGTINYVEGQVSIGAQYLNSKSVGSTQVEEGQSLTTDKGKAEMLLTPGVFLRLNDHSSAQIVSSGLTNTQVAVNQGEAMIEVDNLHPQNDIRIAEDGVTTRLLKTGLYDFDASHNLVRVLDGKASVSENDREVTVKGGHELALNDNSAKPKAQKFDKKEFETTDLYRWSSLRSDYLAQANADTARIYYTGGGLYGPGWFGAGWYWDPWFSSFTFIPGDGIFYSPFGWGFYSPLWAYSAPIYYRGYGRYGTAPVRVAHGPAPYHNRAIHSGFASGGHPVSGGTHSFGAHSAGGGFHGGMGAMHGGFGGRR